MGGSGGGFYSENPEKLKEKIRKAERQAVNASFETDLAGYLNGLLAGFNDRDAELTKKRLQEITQKLEHEVEGTLDTLFGGSVSKHTYVDGLSDIDSLLLINDTELMGKKPATILKHIANLLSKRLSKNIKIETGTLAISLEYADGMKVQLLPAIRTENGVRISSAKSNTWSEIDPSGFTDALTKQNTKAGSKLVPTVKLIKAINGQLPEKLQMTGYHIESLAIEAFKKYTGPKNVKDLLPYFYEKSKELILSPIKDKTGQSIHVDDYLGEANSKERKQISHLLNRILKRMNNASASGSLEQWQGLFGE